MSTKAVFAWLIVILFFGLIAILIQAGISPNQAPSSFWAAMAVATSMTITSYLMGDYV